MLHAYHLYVIKLDPEALNFNRISIFRKLKNKGIGANVHYIPVHLHPFYRKHFGMHRDLCPMAEKVYEQILSLPIFPKMTDEDIKKVINALTEK